MEEFNINLVGNDEEIKKEEIFNDFDFNYVPINNLPVSYFPLNNGLLSNELKKINNEILTGGEDFGGDIPSGTILNIDASKSPYTILVKKNIDCELNLSGTSRKIRLNKGIYTIIFDFNGYNIIQKNNLDIYKELKVVSSVNISLDFLSVANLSNVKKISSNKRKKIDISASTGISIESTADDPNYKLLVYRINTSPNVLKLNKDITCDILIVGGGGSGGNDCHGWEGGGGGGGGGVGMGGNITLKKETYTINIGNGGIAGSTHARGQKGGDTSIICLTISFSETAHGGGYGSYDQAGDGGSGGGASGLGQDRPAGIATKGTGSLLTYYGNNGGYGYNQAGGSGGGGAGSKGTSTTRFQDYNGGNGGNGIQSSITGISNYYGGGGGGSANAFRDSSILHGKGGKGGGGDGGYYNTVTDGWANTGGGGGGANSKLRALQENLDCTTGSKSGAGGSGIVIIRVKREDVEEEITNNDFLTSTDTRIINEINNLLEKKMIEFNNEEKPYNYLGIYPLVILIVIFWIFIFLFLLKFVHHYFASIYIYILLFIIIFLLIFGSLWFLYTNNDLL